MSTPAEVLKAVREWPARYFVAAAVVAVSLLGLSNSRFAALTGADDAPTWLRMALTAVALASLAVASVKTLTLLSDHRRARLRFTAFLRGLHSLTKEEREVMAEFVERERKTARFVLLMSDSAHAVTATDLAKRGYLYEVARNESPLLTQIHYGIHEEVYDYLRDHPKALARPQEAPEPLPDEPEQLG